MADRRVLVLIGAGSAVFTRGLLADLIVAEDLGGWDVRLVDTAEGPLATAVALGRRMVESRGAAERISVTGAVDRRTVLAGADFVVTCIGVGGREAWQLDHEICMRHGVYQPVGDSVLPGGISRLLRTVPVMVQIARDVLELAPSAHFFNYSNPMTANVMAIDRWAEGSDVVGLCHGVSHVQHHLAALVGAPFEQTSTLYAGINHLTFIYDFRWKGEDAWPLVRDVVARQQEDPFDPDRIGDTFADGTHAGQNPFSWELFARFGAFPAAEDRHVTEFFPDRWSSGAYFGKTLGVDAYSVPGVLEWAEDRYRAMVAQADPAVPLDTSIFDRSTGEQEQLISIIRSITHDLRHTYSCNVTNAGTVADLPADAVLEVPGIATARGVRAVKVPDLSPPIVAVLAQRLTSVYLGVEAAMTGHRALAVEAVVADGAVRDAGRAARLVDELVEAQAEHLPLFR